MSNYLLNPFFDSFFEPTTKQNETPSVMDVDIVETDNHYELEADLPGYEKKDVAIEFEKGYLTITAAKERKAVENGRRVYTERRFGKLRRRFYFGEIDEKNITAIMNNGVMVVTLPKQPKEQRVHSISIQ